MIAKGVLPLRHNKHTIGGNSPPKHYEFADMDHLQRLKGPANFGPLILVERIRVV